MSGLAQTLRSQPGRESKKSVGRRQPMAPHEALSQGWPGLASGQFEANARAPSSPGAAVLSYSCVYRFPVRKCWHYYTAATRSCHCHAMSDFCLLLDD